MHSSVEQLVSVNGSSATRRVARSSAIAFVLWGAFFSLQSAMSAALAARAIESPATIIETDVVLGVVWALLSVAVAAWHRRVRATATNLVSLAVLHLPGVLLVVFVDTLVSRLASQYLEHVSVRTPFAASAVFYADLDVASYIAICAIAEALILRDAWLERQRLAKRLESLLGRARLDYLETQLQPHFLFNSLGAVSELAYDAPETADRVLCQLTAIFRTALPKKGDEVTIGEEIVGIEPYLEIQRIRFADWLTIAYRIDQEAMDCLLPRFVLQPLVENAIRHGLSGRFAPGTIEISADVEGDSLYVRVSDNGAGLGPSLLSTGHGIGLSNVRHRLAILYGDDNRLRLAANQSGGAVSELRVPVRKRGQHQPEPMPERAHGIQSWNAELPSLRLPSLLQRRWVMIAVTWTICGLLWCQQSYTYLALRDRLAGRSWLEVGIPDFVSALIWALLTPVVLFFATRLPLRRPLLPLRVAVYALAGAAVTFVHLVLLQRSVLSSVPLSSPTWQINIMVGFIIFCAIAAIAHRGLLIQWVRAREAASAALTTELAEVQRRAGQLEGIPEILLHSLDGIIETVRRDPSRTEHQLMRLADYLRLALDATDEQGMTPDRTRALESAVAALRDSGAYSPALTQSA